MGTITPLTTYPGPPSFPSFSHRKTRINSRVQGKGKPQTSNYITAAAQETWNEAPAMPGPTCLPTVETNANRPITNRRSSPSPRPRYQGSCNRGLNGVAPLEATNQCRRRTREGLVEGREDPCGHGTPFTMFFDGHRWLAQKHPVWGKRQSHR